MKQLAKGKSPVRRVRPIDPVATDYERLKADFRDKPLTPAQYDRLRREAERKSGL